MKKSIIILQTLLVLAGIQMVQAEKVVLTTLDWEPYIGKKLDNGGFVAEIATEAFKRGGYDLEIKYYPWARTKMMAVNGEVDGYFPEYYAEDLKEHSLLSDPFEGGPVGFFKRTGSPITYSTLEELKDCKIGVVRGYVNEENFDAADYLKKEEVKDDLTNIKKLLAERIDLFVGDKFVGFYLLQQNMPHMVGQMQFIEPALANMNLYVCVSKKTADADKKQAAFNAGLESMKADGTLKEIMNKHGF